MLTLDPVKLYFKEIKKIPLVSKEEFNYLFKRVAKGDEAAKRRLIEGNLRLVISIAKRYYNRNINFLDLIAEGNMGLIRALEKFKPSKKTSFSTYATLWIKQAIRRAVQTKEKTIRVPDYVMQKIKKLLSTYEAIKLKSGSQPTVEELAKVLNVSIEEMHRVVRDYEVFQDASSMEAEITDDDSLALKDVIQDRWSITPENNSVNTERTDQVAEILKSLSKKERFIIEHRFGFNGQKMMTLEEIGNKLKLSRERVRQIEEMAKGRIKRRILKTKNFEMGS